MKEFTHTLKTEIVQSDDGKHRYLFKRQWDENKPFLTVITINAGASDGVFSDQTTLLMTNNIYALNKFGGYYAVNLFSGVNVRPNKNSSEQELFNKDTDKYILQAVKDSEQVVVAWGQVGNSNAVADKRQKAVLELLSPHEKKLVAITDEKGRKGVHPLTPSVRRGWELVLFADVEKKAKKRNTLGTEVKTTISVNTKS